MLHHKVCFEWLNYGAVHLNQLDKVDAVYQQVNINQDFICVWAWKICFCEVLQLSFGSWASVCCSILKARLLIGLWNKTNTAKSKNILPSAWLCNNTIEWDEKKIYQTQTTITNAQSQRAAQCKPNHQNTNNKDNDNKRSISDKKCHKQNKRRVQTSTCDATRCCKFAICFVCHWPDSFLPLSLKWNYLTHFNLAYETSDGWSERTIGCESVFFSLSTIFQAEKCNQCKWAHISRCHRARVKDFNVRQRAQCNFQQRLYNVIRIKARICSHL